MRSVRRIFFLALFLVVCANHAGAATIFTKVADTNTPIPGGNGNFGGLGNPSISEGNVAFRGSLASDGFEPGVYTNIGGSLNVVADTTTPIPGGSADFGGVGVPSISGGNVAFRGSLASDGFQPGVYANVGGSLNVVADTSTPIPGGSADFGGVGAPSISGSNVAFRGTLSSDGFQPGVYTNIGGSLNVVADTTTSIPGGSGTFGRLGDPSISGANVAFRGTLGGDGFQPGIYANVGGSLNLVADTMTPIPGGSGNFGGLGDPSISGGNVAFRGSLAGDGFQPGIYLDLGGSLSVVADTTTPIPGGSGNFGGFGDPSISGENVAFLGGPISGEVEGIFIEMNGILEKVIGVSDILDGKTIAQLFMSRDALSGNQLAFRASFTNGGGSGIFIATIPEPSAALLIGCGLFGLAGRRSHSKRTFEYSS